METLRPVEHEQQVAARIFIDMARHSKKGPKPREAISQEGMKMAVEAGLKTDRSAPDGTIYGSLRERTGQSSVLRMFAEELRDEAHFDFDPEDLVRWLQEGGMEKVETPFLNFLAGDGQYADEGNGSYERGMYLQWLVDRSEQAAREFKQSPDKATPFSIEAGNVGSFIVAKVWEMYDALGRGEQVEPKLDFATSHQGVLESFLYKVIRKHDGDEAAAALVQSLNNTGFSENQGYKLEVIVKNKDDHQAWEVKLNYNDKEYRLEPSEIFEIIKGGQDLKKELAELQKTE